MYCSACGTEAAEGSEYCSKCGTRLAVETNATPPQPATHTSAAASSRNRKILYTFAAIVGVSVAGIWLVWQSGLACGDSDTALFLTGLQLVFEPVTPDSWQLTNGATGEGCGR